eukprot:6192261-Pleurochrysis_carterae.AAC.2
MATSAESGKRSVSPIAAVGGRRLPFDGCDCACARRAHTRARARRQRVERTRLADRRLAVDALLRASAGEAERT